MKETKTCIRCGVNTRNFPKPSNRETCGVCLAELHGNWHEAESARVVRGE